MLHLLTLPLEIKHLIFRYYLAGGTARLEVLPADEEIEEGVRSERWFSQFHLLEFLDPQDVQPANLHKTCRVLRKEMLEFAAPNIPLTILWRLELRDIANCRLSALPYTYANSVREVHFMPFTSTLKDHDLGTPFPAPRKVVLRKYLASLWLEVVTDFRRVWTKACIEDDFISRIRSKVADGWTYERAILDYAPNARNIELEVKRPYEGFNFMTEGPVLLEGWTLVSHYTCSIDRP